MPYSNTQKANWPAFFGAISFACNRQGVAMVRAPASQTVHMVLIRVPSQTNDFGNGIHIITARHNVLSAVLTNFRLQVCCWVPYGSLFQFTIAKLSVMYLQQYLQ